MSGVHSIRDELQEFVLENVEVGEERILGTGSYGSVQEVRINGEVYAAKMIHEVLLETEEHGGLENVAVKYLKECRLMSRMRHPNITQFIGVCFLPGSHLPLLVMERLECSLDELVEMTTVPLSVSMYILIGVCRGLLYLHRESVVHRDLTARNILLTASIKAKITDFGNSRIVQVEPGQLAKTLTRFPGTLVYMPPEAHSEHGQYGPSLDVFSFGVLMLFVLTQIFPGDLLPPTYPDPNNPDQLLARSEFDRRNVYISHLEKKLGGQEHALFGVVRECLANNPERRPNTVELLSSLEEAEMEIDGGLLQLDIARVRTVRSLRIRDQRIEELQRELAEKNNLLTQKDCLLAEKDTQIASQHKAFQADLTAKDDITAKKNKEYEAKVKLLVEQAHQKENLITEMKATIVTERERALAERDALIQAHKEQIEGKDAELARRAVLIQHLEEMVRTRDHAIQKRRLSSSGRGPVKKDDSPQSDFSLKWRKGKNMPVKMGTTVQSVVIGDSVYLGGGWAGNRFDMCTVMKFSLQRGEWTRLPPHSTKYFALTSVANQLVLIGGSDSVTEKPTNQIAAFVSGKWYHHYPPMNVARHSSTAVSFNNYIIVAGGRDNQDQRTSSVEVLDVTSGRWYTADPLPNPRNELKSTVIGNTLYLMGGNDHAGPTQSVHKVNLNDLITKAVSKPAKSTPWQVVEDTPLVYSAPLSVRGYFFAVGGRDSHLNPNSSIYFYQHDTRRWVKVGDLPPARFNCTCSVLPNGEVIVAGGETGNLGDVSTVDFLNISEIH